MSNDVRQSIITYKHNNPTATYYTIAKVYSINRSTIRSILLIHNNESRVLKKAKGGAREGNRKYNDDHRELIIDTQLEHPEYTYQQIKQKYFGEARKNISVTKLHTIINDADFTTKKLKTAPIDRNTNQAKEYRAGTHIHTTN